jgi:hypothetical protein
MVLEVGGASQHRVITVGLDLAVVFCVVVSPEQIFNISNISGLQSMLGGLRLRHHTIIAIITSEIRALVVCVEGAYSHV